MNNSGYDELNKKYQDLLEENKYLKARIEKLEAEPHSLESDPKAFQDQKKEEKGTGEMPTIDTSWALFFSLQSSFIVGLFVGGLKKGTTLNN